MATAQPCQLFEWFELSQLRSLRKGHAINMPIKKTKDKKENMNKLMKLSGKVLNA